MVDTVLDDRLKDHAWHGCVEHRLVKLLFVLDISAETNVQNVDIVVDELNLFADRNDLRSFLDIVTEEVRHVFDVAVRLVGAFHHRELRSCVQRVKEEVRIDLRLKVLELCLLKMRLHEQLILPESSLRRGAFPEPVDVVPDADCHLVKGLRNDTDLVVIDNLERRDVEVSASHLAGLLGKVLKRPDDSKRKSRYDDDISRDNKRKDKVTRHLETAERRKQLCVVVGVLGELFVVKAVDRRFDVVKESRGVLIFEAVLLNISSTLIFNGQVDLIYVLLAHPLDTSLHTGKG